MKPITYEEAADTLKNSKVWDLMYKHPDDAEIIGKFSDAAHFAAAAITRPAKDNTFLIVDNGSTERYSKDHYLPTPMPRDAYAVPLDAQVVTWHDTEKAPPTEADGLKTAGFREGEVIAVDLQERIDLWPWHHVAKYWRQYPRWTQVPTPAQTVTPARKEESNV